MFARALAAVGAPAAIAAAALSRETRRRIIGWLSPLETIVRRLLLAEAAELRRRKAPPLASWSARLPPRTAQACKPDKRGGAARSKLDISAPETWRVAFSFSLPRDPHAVPESRAPRIRLLGAAHAAMTPPKPERAGPQRADTPFSLARRLEALRRVLDDPAPHAERLARLLSRAIRRYPQIVRRYWLRSARTGDCDPSDPGLSIDALAASSNAPDAFPDTG